MVAAVAMDVLMALERSLEDAAKLVAAAVQKWPAFRAQTITSTTIRNWRDQVRSPTDARNPQFQQLRDHILGQLSPYSSVQTLEPRIEKAADLVEQIYKRAHEWDMLQ